MRVDPVPKNPMIKCLHTMTPILSNLAKAEITASEHTDDVRKATPKRTLLPPVDGTVQQLRFTRSEVRYAGLASHDSHAKGAGLEIEATLPNKDVRFVQKGQPAEITFTRYRLLHEMVTGLGQDVVAAHEAAKAYDAKRKAADEKREDERQAGQPSYVAHASVDATSVRTEDGVRPIEPSMAVTAEIKTGRRTVIGYLLSP